MTPRFGAIEAGGTKFVCAVGVGPDRIEEQVQFPTTTPDETLERAIQFFKGRSLAALGVGSFGPLDLNRESARYGFITSTPKPGWRDTDLVGRLQAALGIPVGLDTDVNAAARAEWQWGAGAGCAVVLYLTVGTGIGGGVMVHGRPLQGLGHPEMGHVRVPHDLQRDPFAGACPYHGDCLEGLAAGPALRARWGQPAESLPPDHPAWPLEAQYLALALVNYMCILSPMRILLGGGVMQQPGLLPMIRRPAVELLRGYLDLGTVRPDLADYIVAPGLGDRSGILGALALAANAAAAG